MNVSTSISNKHQCKAKAIYCYSTTKKTNNRKNRKILIIPCLLSLQYFRVHCLLVSLKHCQNYSFPDKSQVLFSCFFTQPHTKGLIIILKEIAMLQQLPIFLFLFYFKSLRLPHTMIRFLITSQVNYHLSARVKLIPRCKIILYRLNRSETKTTQC